MVIFLNLYFVTVVTKAKQKSSQADLLADAINKEIKKKIADWQLPPGFTLVFEGENKEVKKSAYAKC